MESRKRNLYRHRRIFSFNRRLILLSLFFILAPVFAYVIFGSLNAPNAVSALNHDNTDPNWELDGLDSETGWQIDDPDSDYDLWEKLYLSNSNNPSDPSYNNNPFTGQIIGPDEYNDPDDRSILNNQSPMLMVGTNEDCGDSGFCKTKLYLNVWVPKADRNGAPVYIDDYTLETYDLCRSPVDANSDPEDGTNIYMLPQQSNNNPLDNNNRITKYEGSRWCGTNSFASFAMHSRFNQPTYTNSNDDARLIYKPDLGAASPTRIEYRKYTILVAVTKNAGSYYNQFRLRLIPNENKHPSLGNAEDDVYIFPGKKINSVLSEHITDDYPVNYKIVRGTNLPPHHLVGEGEDPNNPLRADLKNHSTQYIGFSDTDDNHGFIAGNAIKYPFGSNANRAMMYQTSFIVAPDIEKYKCSNENITGYIGMYDTDRHLKNEDGRTLSGYPEYQRRANIEAKVDVYSMDRSDYADGTGAWVKKDTLEFNGLLDDNDITSNVIRERTSTRSIEENLESTLADFDDELAKINDGEYPADEMTFYGDRFHYDKNNYYTYEKTIDYPAHDAWIPGHTEYTGGPAGDVTPITIPAYPASANGRGYVRHNFYVKHTNDSARPKIVGDYAIPDPPFNHSNYEWGYISQDFEYFRNILGTIRANPRNDDFTPWGIKDEDTTLKGFLETASQASKEAGGRIKVHDPDGPTGPTPPRLDVSSNHWEDKQYVFQADKIYKIRFYNVDPRNYVQYRIPFDYVNTIQDCDAGVVIGLTIGCELYVKNLLWREEIDAKLELRLRRKGTPAPIDSFPYTSLANSSTVPGPQIQFWYDQVDPPAISPYTNTPSGLDYESGNNLIMNLVRPSELLYSSMLNEFDKFEFVLTGRYATDPTDSTTIMPDDSLDSLIKDQVIPIIPDPGRTIPRSYEDCLGYRAKIMARDCKIRFEELYISPAWRN